MHEKVADVEICLCHIFDNFLEPVLAARTVIRIFYFNRQLLQILNKLFLYFIKVRNFFLATMC